MSTGDTGEPTAGNGEVTDNQRSRRQRLERVLWERPRARARWCFRDAENEWRPWVAQNTPRLATALLAFAAVRLALRTIFPFDASEVPPEIVAFAVGGWLLWIYGLLPVREHVALLRSAARRETGAARSALLAFLLFDLKHQVTEGWVELNSGEGWTLALPRFNQLMLQFSRNADAPFLGTTGDVPSRFMSRYQWARQAQDANPGGKRYVIVSEGALAHDLQAEEEQYRRFVEFHREAGIALKRVDPDEFRRLKDNYARELEVRLTPYLTLWANRYAVSLTPKASASDVLEAMSVRLTTRDRTPFGTLEAYLSDLDQASKAFPALPPRASHGG